MTKDRCDLTNLHFPLSYFQDEVREGFYISTMMKRYFASQLKVLSLVAQICDKHDIMWFADCGTLLGAVRHAGFVPWDDDLDICMLRDDWERFFEVAAKELPEGFQVLTIDSQPEYEHAIGRIVNAHSIDIGPERMEQFYGCPYTLGIDIFPLDGLYPDEEKEKERQLRGQKAIAAYNEAGGKDRRLIKKVQEIFREYPASNAENVALMPFYIPYGNHVYPKELFRDVIRLPFENTYINVPARYDEVLEIEYHDYMRIVKGGGIHEYPVFSEQEEQLRQHLGHHPFRYTLDSKELLGSVQRYVLRQAEQFGGSAAMSSGASSKVPGLSKKQAVFLPVRACWWKTMEPLWKEYSDNPEYEVHVLPIFYYDCDHTGAVDTENRHDERTLFPKYVHVEDCEKYDFASVHPEVIVIQLPYDGNSTAITVHEFFYSANLLNFTDELVYVPYLDMDAPKESGDKASAAIKVFVEQEGVVNADRVVVSSEKMARFYVDTLTLVTGKETESYWKQKVSSLDDVVARLGGNTEGQTETDSSGPDRDACSEAGDRYTGVQNEMMCSWKELLGDQYGKKVMIYYVSIAFLLRNQEKGIEKIRRSLEIFRDASDRICAVIVPQPQILTDLARIDENLWRQYCEVVGTCSNIIYDEKGIALDYIDLWNAYYGDASPIVRECVMRKIPVMIENVDI